MSQVGLDFQSDTCTHPIEHGWISAEWAWCIGRGSTTMNRRHFLQGAATIIASNAILQAHANAGVAPKPLSRIFHLTTRIELTHSDALTRVWIPLPLTKETPFQQHLVTTVQCDCGHWDRHNHPEHAMGMLVAEFPAGSNPVLTVKSRVRLRDWTVDLQKPTRIGILSPAERQIYLKPTRQVPTDGVVRSTALAITQGAKTDEDQARAIYEWMIAHTYRKASVRGCGNGNIRALLETGDLGGKCADLSALFVGLARAVGLPARDVYGIRVGPSHRGYTSLGPTTGMVSRAQHCRAEVWLQRFGWVPLDPADVRKVILEESSGNQSLGEHLVQLARKQMFGSWEMNWIAFNYGQDVSLPGSNGPALPFFMYPQAETASRRADSLDPDTFRYQITSVEV
ncbi:MAG: transglutaminase-like domain-containing protein [Janthinobacterium lividum]